MNQEHSFRFALDVVLARRDITRDTSPSSMVDAWAAFVADCEEGYTFDLSEYDNDISVRRWLEDLLTAPELQHFPELKELAAAVHRTDERFRALLQPDTTRPAASEHWWDRGVLRHAGREYVDDVQSLYGIKVRVIE